ncbi:hypothetical protein [Bacillus atrophaeus]|uniref:hypothetical protein n=1 Tax=Bacillus atrophaeus TaxID=1452 RepID=UPI002DB72F2D|nr:hypothetical protein [Bacillus atrophaeus]MEC1900949.1 hypothetical protein [Bacillus atrophaeus]MEC2396114.1 hypothetical protein [Bacillus atrophaeus]MED4437286.1 hypothetical protein [Bacillus atrophaeus]MED4567030.1 hypothetical protein [Bacillus atrophaeus]MED4573352.1 hypothetical protein [Bacillus atrophaeus]
MAEITKEKLEEQLQIAAYKSVSLLQELNDKNKELAEYKALYTFADKKREELQNQLDALVQNGQKESPTKENSAESAPVTE